MKVLSHLLEAAFPLSSWAKLQYEANMNETSNYNQPKQGNCSCSEIYRSCWPAMLCSVLLGPHWSLFSLFALVFRATERIAIENKGNVMSDVEIIQELCLLVVVSGLIMVFRSGAPLHLIQLNIWFRFCYLMCFSEECFYSGIGIFDWQWDSMNLMLLQM